MGLVGSAAEGQDDLRSVCEGRCSVKQGRAVQLDDMVAKVCDGPGRSPPLEVLDQGGYPISPYGDWKL